MIPFFPGMDSEAETAADLHPDPDSLVEERRQEMQMRIAGALARRAEAAGLIQRTDDFSWEWHQQFDNDFEAAQAAASTALSPTDADPQAPPAVVTANVPVTDGEFGAEFGTGGTLGGDLGGGGEFGGNF